jgi:hypothetical protein
MTAAKTGVRAAGAWHGHRERLSLVPVVRQKALSCYGSRATSDAGSIPSFSGPGTKRVRQLGHPRARPSIWERVEPPDLQEKAARACPRVDACPSLVFPS